MHSMQAVLTTSIWIQIESLSPLKCGEKRKGIKKGRGLPGSHPRSRFLRACSVRSNVTLLQITFLFATQASLILYFRASADGLQGLRRNLMAAMNYLVCFFFTLL